MKEKTLGVCFHEPGMASVRLWAPLAAKADLVLVDKNQTVSLSPEPGGYWVTKTNGIQPGDLYQFSLDGRKPFPDPASLSQPQGVHGASCAIDLRSLAHGAMNWNNHPLEDYIIYELHTGTFSNEGTFSGIIEKLDHLASLGINAIEVMPVAQFPGERNWGYDGVFPFAVQDSYGGANGLKELVNACHAKGIAVILDVVYNHLGPEGAYHSIYGPYFTDKYKTPWGGAVNFDDAWCDGVRSYFIENAIMWLRDFGIDALRLDAVHAIKDFSPVHFLQHLRKEVDALMEATGNRHYLIVELDLNDTRYIGSPSQGGYGMDAQWIDEFHHALRVTATGEKTGYYSDFSGIGHLAKSYNDAYVYDGQFSPHRKKYFGVPAREAAGKQFIVFSQNHDQVGNRMLGERTGTLVSFEMQKLLAGAVLVSPFLPMLFMGEEWNAPEPFLYFVSHTDPGLADAVRKGRREEFAAFHATGEAPDPVAEETFLRSKPDWSKCNTGAHAVMLRYYKDLIALRKQMPALKTLDRAAVKATADEAKNTLLLVRGHNEGALYCYFNFSGLPQLHTLHGNPGSMQLVFASADPLYGGNGNPSVQGDRITLPPESISIYKIQ